MFGPSAQDNNSHAKCLLTYREDENTLSREVERGGAGGGSSKSRAVAFPSGFGAQWRPPECQCNVQSRIISVIFSCMRLGLCWRSLGGKHF